MEREMKRAMLLALVAMMGCAYDTDGPGEEIGASRQAISNPIGGATFRPGLVRLDRPDGRRCSGFFIGPNMIVTAAHCVVPNVSASPSGTWDGMNWGYVRLRIVYKPSSSEVMCINETCRNADSTTRRTTVRAWWDVNYPGGGLSQTDLAVVTRVNGGNFLTRAADVDDPAPRSLNGNDYLRILAGTLSPSHDLDIWGYGAFTDTQLDANARVGWVESPGWFSHHIRANADNESRICRGDSGGPLVFRYGALSRNFVAGVASNTGISNGWCPEYGQAMRWTRTGPRVWMFNRILSWAGQISCQYATGSDIPGNGAYYRCW